MSSSTFVLVHGAWHGSWAWTALTEEFDRRGIQWLTLDLPSSHDTANGTADLDSDVDTVVSVAQFAGPVTLVGHSYGGAVVTEAAGRLENACALVYVAALIPTIGQSTTEVSRLASARTDLDDAMVVEGPWLRLDPQRAASALYGDCSSDTAAAAIRLLGRQTIASFRSRRTSPDRLVTRRYIRCTRDQAISPSLQTLMAASCDSVVDIASDHSPFLSHPGECADAILDF